MVKICLPEPALGSVRMVVAQQAHYWCAQLTECTIKVLFSRADLVRRCGTMRGGFCSPILCGFFVKPRLVRAADGSKEGRTCTLLWAKCVAQKVLFPLGA
jgi:hypothetical protein